MSARVLLQAGHSAEFTPFHAGGGGAPGEADWNSRLVRALAAELRTYDGVSVEIVGSFMSNGFTINPPGAISQPHDLFLSSHYDAAIYGVGGGFVDRYRPENYGRKPTGQANAEENFMGLFEQTFFPSLGILHKPQRRNPNTNDYYAFRYLHHKTPRVLIEFGVGAPGVGQDSKVLWGELGRVAAVTARIVVESLVQRGVLDRAEPVEPEVPDMFEQPLTRAQAVANVQQFGFELPEGFAISERIIESAMVNGGKEWRGPVISEEYPYTHPDGKETTRRDCTAGTAEYDPGTGTVGWVEVVSEARA